MSYPYSKLEPIYAIYALRFKGFKMAFGSGVIANNKRFVFFYVYFWVLYDFSRARARIKMMMLKIYENIIKF